jgi:hypothetical protein
MPPCPAEHPALPGDLTNRPALRCLYQRAVDDGLIGEADNPARKVAKPRRLPSTRRAVADTRLAEINQAAATTGNDPELDTLLLRLHTETACRRGGALALRPADLDSGQCLILLREKGETVRWQPVSPTLIARLLQHAASATLRQAGSYCATPMVSRSPAAGMTTCGPASASTCPGWPLSRSGLLGHCLADLQLVGHSWVSVAWVILFGIRTRKDRACVPGAFAAGVARRQ